MPVFHDLASIYMLELVQDSGQKYLKLGQSIKHILIEIMPPLDFGFQPYFVWKPRTCGYMPDFHDLASIYMLELAQDSGQNIWNSNSQSSISWLKQCHFLIFLRKHNTVTSLLTRSSRYDFKHQIHFSLIKKVDNTKYVIKVLHYVSDTLVYLLNHGFLPKIRLVHLN